MPQKFKMNKKRKVEDPLTPRNERQICFNTYRDNQVLTPRESLRHLNREESRLNEDIEEASDISKKEEGKNFLRVVQAEISICEAYLARQKLRSKSFRTKHKQIVPPSQQRLARSPLTLLHLRCLDMMIKINKVCSVKFPFCEKIGGVV